MKRTRVILAFLALAAVCACVAPLVAKSGNNPSIDGDYDVVFRGAYDGDGTAKVVGNGKKIVWIKGDLRDTRNGGTGQFKVMNLPFNDEGRFSGVGDFKFGTGNKVDVTIVGRLEPADNNVIKKTRIICTFTTADGGAGRVQGSH